MPRPTRPNAWLLALTVLGVAAMGYVVYDEVTAIRAQSEQYERAQRRIEDLMPGGPAARPTPVERGPDAVVRLTEVQRPGPGVPGRYDLDVGAMRWALDTPAADDDEAARAAWAEQALPRWAALRASLEALAAGGRVRAEIFAPWQDEPEAVPAEFLVRLMVNLAAAGIVDVDIEHAPPDLLAEEDEGR